MVQKEKMKDLLKKHLRPLYWTAFTNKQKTCKTIGDTQDESERKTYLVTMLITSSFSASWWTTFSTTSTTTSPKPSTMLLTLLAISFRYKVLSVSNGRNTYASLKMALETLVCLKSESKTWNWKVGRESRILLFKEMEACALKMVVRGQMKGHACSTRCKILSFLVLSQYCRIWGTAASINDQCVGWFHQHVALSWQGHWKGQSYSLKR